VRDQSSALRLLATFEPDAERRRQMHKRRAALLDALVRQLNPRHFGALCRQLYVDLAEAHVALLDQRVDQLEQQSP